MKSTKKTILICFIVLTSLLTPLSLVSALFVLNSINPMQQVFLASFKIRNESSERIFITPVGTWGKEGNKTRLSTFFIRFPAILSTVKGNYYLRPGESKKIIFDWDSTNLSEIAVQTKEGQYYQYLINANPTKNMYYAPDKDLYIIPDIDELDEINPQVLEIVEHQKNGFSLFEFLLTLGLVIPFVLKRLVIEYKKEKNSTIG